MEISRRSLLHGARAAAAPVPPGLSGGPRDIAKVREAVKAAGCAGKRVVLVPTSPTARKPRGDVAADMLRQAGLDVEHAGMDFGPVLQRQQRRWPVAGGGWSAGAGNWQGIHCLDPAGHPLLPGDGSVAGLPAQQRLCRDIQALAFEAVPFLPLGEYRQPTAYRDTITGVLDGTAVFWNVRPA